MPQASPVVRIPNQGLPCIGSVPRPQLSLVSTQPQPALRLCGIIGYPLGHSISPAFQQAALDELGVALRYERWPTAPEDLAARIRSLRAPAIAGANVTVPYKERVASLIDVIDPLAVSIGAVNTIVNHEGRLFGYNTDAPGFLRALQENGPFNAMGASALVLGAGGAARAVVFALASAGVAGIAISNRTQSRAEALAATVRQQGRCPVRTLPWGEGLPGVSLIVNTTTMGMRGGSDEAHSPMPSALIPPGAFVCDLVYNPEETPFLLAARNAGAHTLSGLPMLVYQGAIAFELWTGRRPPVGTMFAAARRALA